MTMKRIAVLIVLLLSVAAHAEAQPMEAPALRIQLQEVERHLVRGGITEGDAQAMVRAMTDARFTVEQMVRASKQLVSDDSRGITGPAVRDKIHEGIAKGIPPEAILAAAARVKNRQEYASKLAADLRETNKMQVATAYADCLAAGLTEQHAHQLNNALNARTETPGGVGSQSLVTETLLTAREMVRRNISSTTTIGVLESALDRGYGDKEMRTLRQSLAGSSGDPENNAKRFGAAIDQGVRGGELQGLGNSGHGIGEKSGMGTGQGSSGSGGSGGGSGGSGGSSGGSGGGRR
jgi:hypothetical protein